MWLKQKRARNQACARFQTLAYGSLPRARVARAPHALPNARLRLAIKRTPRRLVVASSSTCFGFKFGFELEFKFEFEFGLKYGFNKIC